jgi:hypothetical protein
MHTSSLFHRFARVGGLSIARVSGAVLVTLLFFLVSAAQTPRVITNKDLEPFRLRREAQEAEYERTHRERGMPSREELQQYFEELDRRLHESSLRFEKERAEAELESMRSELVNVRRNLYELSLSLSQPTVAYRPAYAYADYYPYYYAPPVQFITRFPFGRHGGFGRGNFGPHPRARVWPHNLWQGGPFSSSHGARLWGNISPRTPAPAMPAGRR